MSNPVSNAFELYNQAMVQVANGREHIYLTVTRPTCPRGEKVKLIPGVMCPILSSMIMSDGTCRITVTCNPQKLADKIAEGILV